MIQFSVLKKPFNQGKTRKPIETIANDIHYIYGLNKQLKSTTTTLKPRFHSIARLAAYLQIYRKHFFLLELLL